jgi:hypothetical protein
VGRRDPSGYKSREDHVTAARFNQTQCYTWTDLTFDPVGHYLCTCPQAKPSFHLDTCDFTIRYVWGPFVRDRVECPRCDCNYRCGKRTQRCQGSCKPGMPTPIEFAKVLTRYFPGCRYFLKYLQGDPQQDRGAAILDCCDALTGPASFPGAPSLPYLPSTEVALLACRESLGHIAASIGK